MKATWLLLSVLFLKTSLSAQEWPPVGSEWHYTFKPCSDIYCPDVEEYIYYKTLQDTTINDTVCKQIRVERHQADGSVEYLGNEFLFSTGSRVYNYHHGQFWLLYDFSVDVGDTLVLSLGANSDIYIQENYSGSDPVEIKHKITDKDSIEIAGKKHLSLTYEIIWPDNIDIPYYVHFKGKIIQGIGSKQLLTGDLFVPIESNYYGPLRCYSDTSLEYHNQQGVPCDTLITSSDNVIVKEGIKIYPVPSRDHLHIQSDNWKIKELTLFDLSGKLILTITGINEDFYVLTTSNLKKGAYIVFVRTEKYVVNQKIILQ